MRIILLSLVFIATTAVAAHARIGETPDQLVARYGQPLNETDQKAEGDKIALAHVSFQKGGFQIEVTISGGLSVEEIFKKLNGQSITVDEAHILLTANAGGQNWSFPDKGKDAITWTRDDHALAKLTSDGTMTIRSQDLVVQQAAAEHLKQRPTLDGF
jgi:hypothetical protein